MSEPSTSAVAAAAEKGYQPELYRLVDPDDPSRTVADALDELRWLKHPPPPPAGTHVYGTRLLHRERRGAIERELYGAYGLAEIPVAGWEDVFQAAMGADPDRPDKRVVRRLLAYEDAIRMLLDAGEELAAVHRNRQAVWHEHRCGINDHEQVTDETGCGAPSCSRSGRVLDRWHRVASLWSP